MPAEMVLRETDAVPAERLTGAVADFNRIDPPLPAPGDPFKDSAGKE